MKQKKFVGKLIAIDMYNCGTEEISDTAVAEEILRKGCEEFNMNCRDIICCKEDEEQEYSLFAVCKHGHVTLHVYPEIGFMCADIFCNATNQEAENFARYLRIAYDADKSKITMLDRGDFGSKNDMKPTHRSKIKLIRRTKNVTSNMSAKLKKLMLKPRSI
ncbi:MAG: S-adenosylmethionine decarboxylase [Phascolarctobacterium sp.]|nr:S-adenosylmethionine decarboxylase [Phascolarctobacterium sp.]